MTKNYENFIIDVEKDPNFYSAMNNHGLSLLENINWYINDLYSEKIIGLAKEWNVSNEEMQQFISCELMTSFWFGFRKFKNLKS